jgi:hypothetical protein
MLLMLSAAAWSSPKPRMRAGSRGGVK